MQAHFPSLTLILALFGLSAAGTLAADEVRSNLLEVPLKDWKSGEGMTLNIQAGELELTSEQPASPRSWVAPKVTLPYSPDTKLQASVKELTSGNLVVQLEWLNDQGNFIASSEAMQVVPGEEKSMEVMLSDLNPPKGTSQVQLKLWLNGEGAIAEVDALLLKTPLLWRQSGLKTSTVYDGTSTLDERSEGLTVSPQSDELIVKLTDGVDHGSFVFSEKTDYSAAGAVMLYLAQLEDGKMTVQALCWDAQGKFLKSVDLFKDVAKSGLYEVPYSIYADQIPEGTAQVSFKVWLLGIKANAVLGSLLVGVDSKA